MLTVIATYLQLYKFFEHSVYYSYWGFNLQKVDAFFAQSSPFGI